jgi:hypothetical protein
VNTIAFRLTATIVGLLVGLGVLAPTAAQADELPAYPSTGLGGVSFGTTSDKQVAGMTVSLQNVLPDSTVTLLVVGCDGHTAYTKRMSGQGNFDLSAELYMIRKKLGAAIPFTLTYAAPGYTDTTASHTVSHPFPAVGQANCAGDGDTGCGCSTATPSAKSLVKKWSHKRGVPKVGRKLWVTKTAVKPGARVAYKWYVGGKLKDRDRVLKVKRGMKGKRAALVVTVTREGFKPAKRTLTYKRIR